VKAEITKVGLDLLEGGHKLPLMEEFYTIQGEGFHSGKPAYFIRVGGCDVGCHWCDVKESWDPQVHPLTAVKNIVANANQYPAKAVVVTGGEPSMYPMGPLTDQLLAAGIQPFIETSGAYPLSGNWHWICLSPKKTGPPVGDIYERAHELKVIVYNKSDFAWAEEHAAQVGDKCLLYLQPEWSKMDQMMDEIVAYTMAHPKWNVSLQSHKFMNIP